MEINTSEMNPWMSFEWRLGNNNGLNVKVYVNFFTQQAQIPTFRKNQLRLSACYEHEQHIVMRTNKSKK